MASPFVVNMPSGFFVGREFCETPKRFYRCGCCEQWHPEGFDGD